MDQEQITCPLCKQPVDALEFELHESVDLIVLDWIRRQHPEWTSDDGLCDRCLKLYREMKSSGGDLSKAANDE